jgi:hypothetical protein
VGEARSVAKGFAHAEARGGGSAYSAFLRTSFSSRSREDRRACSPETRLWTFSYSTSKVTGSAGSLATPVAVAIRCAEPCARARRGHFKPRGVPQTFKEYLRQRFQEHGLSGVRLTQGIRKMGFEGSERTVCRFLATLRVRRPSQLTIRFETPPGEQAQADWAEAGRYHLADGAIRVFFFVMVLGFSRALYIEFTRSMRLESLIRCHQNAFAYFGGWPADLVS